MNTQEELIRGVAEATGADIVFSPDGTCDFIIDEVVISASYRETPRDWLLVTTVLDAGEEKLPPGVPAAVLRQSLFGAGTRGFMPGLFANAIVLSGTVPEDGLTVDGFIAACALLANASATLAADLEGVSESDTGQDEVTDEPPAFGRLVV